MPVKKEEVKTVVTPEVKAEEQYHKNMRFYGKVQDTPKEAQKEFNNGRFSGTDINPMWRIKKLTELFGPSGIGWWTQNVQYQMVPSEATKDIAVFCTLELVYVDPETGLESKPVYGVGGNMFVAQRKNGPQSSDEAYKMAYTDALSIACKALGFSHDIYYQKDRTKYTNPDDPSAGEDLAELQNNIYAMVKEYMALVKMDQDGKKKFVTDFLIPIVGGNGNYRECNDAVKLKKVISELEKMMKKPAA